ncbi:hypothetical protein AA101099_2700 [Neoasaia chiangmaiensis NBRC 101099]|uniref:Uncharacterized protein n=1 Tax=Neoasaia chiangmaiensis TaxID=320497 RepID=A0A1U9KPM2_9PROT|nr:hypothetical protein [Neoasaia chiangmaiensis]AQS87650.1 hypothetical protein A0U93_06550 [Neoasaia chiangmaiensis]GBR41983.1 hypothetical protein AA101099_2700 [Neoasaia chiangmaiensis NBRC 101099]GEN14223.1 hypothetical protein NCH01_06540 [Neoasaia chiangmaiensis]
MKNLLHKPLRFAFGLFSRGRAVFWPVQTTDRIAIIATVISIAAAGATVWSAFFAKDQASSARISAKAAADSVPYARASADAAVETLRRSDENLQIFLDLDRTHPATIAYVPGAGFSVSVFSDAVIVNTGGTPAVITDRLVTTYAGAAQYSSRVDIFDGATGQLWPKFAVIRPGEPVHLRLRGWIHADAPQFGKLINFVSTLFPGGETAPGQQDRQFASLEALRDEISRHAPPDVSEALDRLLYGPGINSHSLPSSPWSEKGQTGFSRMTLVLRTAASRTYKSTPSLFALGPDPSGYIP